MSDIPTLFDLSDRVAVVTGGAGLLGAQFCRSLAQAGAQVVIADQYAKAASELADALAAEGHQVLAVETNVTDPESTKDDTDLQLIWDWAAEAILAREAIVFIGYSLPQYDSFSVKFFSHLSNGQIIEVYVQGTSK